MKQFHLIWLLLLALSSGVCAQSIEELEKLGTEKMNGGNYSEALNYYQQAIALVKDEQSHSVAYAYAAMCAQELGDNALAKTYYIESVNRGIEEAIVFDALGNLARKEKDYDTQLLAYKAGLERSPADQQKYLLKLCSVYKKQKNAEELLASAVLALENNPTDLKALEYKGTALQYQKKMGEAQVVFKELYTLDSESINANIFLGNYNYQVGKSKLNSARKKYDAIPNPTRVQWHENNEKSKVIMAKYYGPAIAYLEYVYSKNPSKSIKNMLFVMHTKMGEKEKAALYQDGQ